tara:strand:- start:111 stop:824 length:714 start_codon:yes stop_codon:yes gene_type:complete
MKNVGLLEAGHLSCMGSITEVISGLHIAAGGFQQASGVGLKPALTSAETEVSMLRLVESVVNALLDRLTRMRELAVQGTWSWLAESDKLFLLHEFRGLAEELANVADQHHHAIGLMSRGVNSASGRPMEFSPVRLGIPVERIDIGSMGAARNSIVMIDTALDRLKAIQAEYDFVDEQINAALSVLKSHVGSCDTEVSGQHQVADPVERVRLMAMQKDGVTPIDEDLDFQQSIRALVQ